MQHPTTPRYCLQDFLDTKAVATARTGGSYKFIAFAHHLNHTCTRKCSSSQSATPSTLTTVRSTTEPPCALSQRICSLEQMNTHSSLKFHCFFLFQLVRYLSPENNNNKQIQLSVQALPQKLADILRYHISTLPPSFLPPSNPYHHPTLEPAKESS